MVADADGEALPGSGKYGERAIVYLQEFAGVFEEGCARRRKLHVPGRSLDEPAAEPLFEPLQLQADRSLRRSHGFSRAREAVELGDAHESLHGIQVEGAFDHFQALSLISISIAYQNNQATFNVKPGQNGKGPAMPLIHISLRAGKPEAYRQAIFDSLYRAMREALNVPEDDQFMTIMEHDAANFRYCNAYGVARSANVVYIQITVFNTRTVEQKKALFRRIAELLGESPGIRPEDVFVNIVDAAKENWSVGHGLAQFA
jgi:4-oxalocrotonate tautomerase